MESLMNEFKELNDQKDESQKQMGNLINELKRQANKKKTNGKEIESRGQ